MSMILLVSAMGLASTLIHRVNHLWSDAQNYQFAVNELSNQLQQLVPLSPDDAKDAIDAIAPSDACKDTLREPKLVGVLAEDELGSRVTLQLTWKDRGEAKPIMLSAWLQHQRATAEASQ